MALAIVVGFLSVVGFVLRGQVNDARTRLAAIETGTKIGQIATCYASARARPNLIIILRGIASKLDPDPRDATNDLVDQYEANTPTTDECNRRARAAGLDPRDFPPVSRGKEGNGR